MTRGIPTALRFRCDLCHCFRIEDPVTSFDPLKTNPSFTLLSGLRISVTFSRLSSFFIGFIVVVIIIIIVGFIVRSQFCHSRIRIVGDWFGSTCHLGSAISSVLRLHEMVNRPFEIMVALYRSEIRHFWLSKLTQKLSCDVKGNCDAQKAELYPVFLVLYPVFHGENPVRLVKIRYFLSH
jgi:hypothetical protein